MREDKETPLAAQTTTSLSQHLKLGPILAAQSMEILRHGNNLQSDLGEMSVWPGFQASYQAQAGPEEKGKYFYQNNEIFKSNEGDKAIREILHRLEERDQTYLGPVGERPVTGDQYLQTAILCASLLALILILAILVVHRKHTRSLQVSTEGRGEPRDTVIVVSAEDNNNTTTTTFICDRDVESNLSTSNSTNQTSQL